MKDAYLIICAAVAGFGGRGLFDAITTRYFRRRLDQTRTATTPPHETVLPRGDVGVMQLLMTELDPCVDCSSSPAVHLTIDRDRYHDGHDWDAILLHDADCPALAAARAKRAGLPPTTVTP